MAPAWTLRQNRRTSLTALPMRVLRALLFGLLLSCGPLYAAGTATEAPVRVFAAASLTDALNDAAAHWRDESRRLERLRRKRRHA